MFSSLGTGKPPPLDSSDCTTITRIVVSRRHAQVVQAKFSEVETRMREQMGEFQRKLTDDLCLYFKEHDGVIPRSIDGIFGDKGALTRTFSSYFDPAEGKLCRLMTAHIGPESGFGKALDPQNKQGIVALIEARVLEIAAEGRARRAAGGQEEPRRDVRHLRIRSRL
jgi:hypothetical protein